MKRAAALLAAAAACLALITGSANGAERLRIATTTSTDNTGLLGVIDKVYTEKTGVPVDVIAVGTGKALRLGEQGDVDLVLVHAPEWELAFVKAGHGVDRQAVMHNDFVVLGPPDDPANLRRVDNPAAAFRSIAEREATFVSRGDQSGTHKKELALWQQAGVTPQGKWYLEVGQGMGAVLQIANDKLAYTLSDRGTYLAYKGRIDLIIVFEGDPALYNPYHVIAVNPERHPHVNYQAARAYIDFITSAEAQRLIGDFRVDGKVLFVPDALRSE